MALVKADRPQPGRTPFFSKKVSFCREQTQVVVTLKEEAVMAGFCTHC